MAWGLHGATPVFYGEKNQSVTLPPPPVIFRRS